MFRRVSKGFSGTASHLVGAIDIGSSKISAALGRVDTQENLMILGVSQQASKGIRKGAMIDMHALEESIRGSVFSVEQKTRQTMGQVYVSLSPSLTETTVIRAEASITGHAVDTRDINKMMAQAKEVAMKPGYEIVHALATSFEIDGIGGIRDPRGMYGDTLAARVLLVIAPQGPLRNLRACIERCHLKLKGIVVSSYASSLACLLPDEMDLGVLLLDMGASATTYLYFYQNELRHIGSLGYGGHHITQDIAMGLSTSLAHAERLKTLYGSAMLSPTAHRESFSLSHLGDGYKNRENQVTRAELVRIIRPRTEEIFELIGHRLRSLKIEGMKQCRLVLTGGSSQLSGTQEMATLVLGRQSRIGYPLVIKEQGKITRNPGYSTCMGLLEYARTDPFLFHDGRNTRGGGLLKRLFHKPAA